MTMVLTRQMFLDVMACLIHVSITLILTSLVAPAHAVSYEFTDTPGKGPGNFSSLIVNFNGLTSPSTRNSSRKNSTAGSARSRPPVMEKTTADDVPRDSPTALVIASSIAAVCILIFFVIAYLWHTHQLDSRARKLAIRLAAEAESGLRSRNSGSQVPRKYPKVIPKERSQGLSESSEDQNHYAILPPDESRGPSIDAGRNSSGASESEADGNEGDFEQIKLPAIGERGKNASRGGRGAHRKWNRSRKSVSGANLEKRGSAITDKEVLSHFASRRHSTFFI